MLVGLLAPAFTPCRRACRYLSSQFFFPLVLGSQWGSSSEGAFYAQLSTSNWPLGHWPGAIFKPLSQLISAPQHWTGWGEATDSPPRWGGESGKWTLDQLVPEVFWSMKGYDASSWEDQSWKMVGSRRQFLPLVESHWGQYAAVPVSLLEAFEVIGQLPLEPTGDPAHWLWGLWSWGHSSFRSIRRKRCNRSR